MKGNAFKGCFGGVVLFIVMLVWLEVAYPVGNDKDVGSFACCLGISIVFAIILVVRTIGRKKEN